MGNFLEETYHVIISLTSYQSLTDLKRTANTSSWILIYGTRTTAGRWCLNDFQIWDMDENITDTWSMQRYIQNSQDSENVA